MVETIKFDRWNGFEIPILLGKTRFVKVKTQFTSCISHHQDMVKTKAKFSLLIQGREREIKCTIRVKRHVYS